MAPSFTRLRTLPLLPLLLQPLLLLLLCTAPGSPTPVRYDQRQTGNVNVQVDLKDVEIYAILDGSLLSGLGMGDYDYDYSQLTEKPPATTAKPGNTTTTSAKPPATSSATTKKPSVRTSEIKSNVIVPEKAVERSASVPSKQVDVSSIAAAATAATATTAAPTPVKSFQKAATPVKISVAHRRCGAGYHRDASGRCRRDRRPLLKYSMKHRRPASRAKVQPAAAAPTPSPPLPAAAAVPTPSPPLPAAAAAPTPSPPLSAAAVSSPTTVIVLSPSTDAAVTTSGSSILQESHAHKTAASPMAHPGKPDEAKLDENKVKANKPEVKANEPEVKANEPEVKANEPEVKANEPEVKANEPEVKANEPEVKANEPEDKANEPEGKANKPKAETIQTVPEEHKKVLGIAPEEPKVDLKHGSKETARETHDGSMPDQRTQRPSL